MLWEIILKKCCTDLCKLFINSFSLDEVKIMIIIIIIIIKRGCQMQGWESAIYIPEDPSLTMLTYRKKEENRKTAKDKTEATGNEKALVLLLKTPTPHPRIETLRDTDRH